MSASNTEPPRGPLISIEDIFSSCRKHAATPRKSLRKLREFCCGKLTALKNYAYSFKQTDPCAIAKSLFQLKTLSCLVPLFLISFGPLYLLDKLDPFGLSKQVQSYSERLVQKVTAPFYTDEAQEKIAVVLIDKTSLDARGESWPPRYVFYEEVVRRIARQKPAAIFLDVLVEDKRVYDDSLTVARQALGDTLSKTGVPLYLAALGTEGNSVFNGVPGTQTTLSGWRGFGEDYPLALSPGHFYGQHDSDLVPDAQCDTRQNRTAAFQIYQQLCEQGVQKGCAASTQTGSAEQFCDAMVVQWGRHVSKVVPERQLISATQCTTTDQGLLTRISESSRAFIASLFAGYDEQGIKQLRQPCPYAVTIREEDLSSEKARDLLTGRVVMIGLSLPAIHDMVDSPVHGQIPGVYLHAMALDNLLKWNADYFSRTEAPVDWGLMLAIFIVCWLCVAIIRTQPTRLSALLRLVALAAVVLYSALLYWWQCPPSDWLAMLLVLELVKRLIEKNTKPNEAEGQGEKSNEATPATHS